MNIRLLTSVIACLFAFPAAAADVTAADEAAPAPLNTLYDDGRDISVWLGAGARYQPKYDGADTYHAVPYPVIAVSYLRLPVLGEVADEENQSTRGFFFFPSFRYIGSRSASDNLALTGMVDVDWALELGLGGGFRYDWFRAYALARYGFNGYSGWFGELGADAVWEPTDQWQFSGGPRLSLAGDSYMDTYFGVTPAESGTSIFPAYNPNGGIRSAGLAGYASYEFARDWRAILELRYDRLMGDAADSPLLTVGDKNQYTVGLGLAKKFTLDLY